MKWVPWHSVFRVDVNNLHCSYDDNYIKSRYIIFLKAIQHTMSLQLVFIGIVFSNLQPLALLGPYTHNLSYLQPSNRITDATTWYGSSDSILDAYI